MLKTNNLGQDEIVEMLITNGADINQKNFQKNSALDVAHFSGNSKVVDLLKRYQKTTNP